MKAARQSLTPWAIPLVLLLCWGSVPARAQYSGGTGEPNDPYRIASVADLLEVSARPTDWDKDFVLVDHVDMDGHPLTDAVISRGEVADQQWSTGTLFTGTFDGNDLAIRNLVLDSGGQKRDCVALFGGIGTAGVVKNLRVENAYVAAADYVGALAGINQGRVENCIAGGFVSGDRTVGGLLGENQGSILDSLSTGEVNVNNNDVDSENVGGLVGRNAQEAAISKCRSTGEISGFDKTGEDFGGLVGWNQGAVLHCHSSGPVSGYSDTSTNFGGLIGHNEGTVIDCYSEGAVVNNENVGGLIGRNTGRVRDCYCTGSAAGNRYVGGLVGFNNGTATHCYSIGAVIGQANQGGLVGHNAYSTRVKDCFWDVNSSGLDTSAAGTGLPTTEMTDASTYQAAGWDFVGIREDGLHETWTMSQAQGYPVLSIFNGYEPAALAGSGTLRDPYRICDAEQLAAVFYGDPTAHYHLACDVNLAQIHWSAAILPEFGGCFDGNGLVVSGLTISSIDPAGLFGTIHSQATVRNVGVEDANVAGADYVGGLGGRNSGKIHGCYVTGKVKGTNLVGGLTGGNEGGEIANAYSTAEVEGRTQVGGLAGRSSEGHIRSCYAAGRVTGSTDAGGLIGSRASSSVVACFWDMQVSGWITGNAGLGKTTEQMQTADTFLNAGWDFVGERGNGLHEIWQMPLGVGYPVLGRFNGYRPPQLAGDGTADDPYRLSDANELGAVVHHEAGAAYVLAADIDLTGITWSTSAVIPEFSGACDGNDRTISGLNVDVPDANYVGLFGRLREGAEIWNLRLVDARVAGTSSHVGILAGSSRGSVIDCRANGTVEGVDYVGGLVGLNEGVVADCNMAIAISGTDCVGGLVGCNFGGALETCSVTGVVEGQNYVGCLVGSNTGTVAQCHSDCNEVVGEICVGGLIGNNTGDVAECFADCNDVVGNDRVGGIAGDNNHGHVVDCYHVGPVSGATKVGGVAGNNYRYGSIIRCYSTGAVNGSENVGGITGHNQERICWDVIQFPFKWTECETYRGVISSCFWDIDACENDSLKENPDRWAAASSDMRDKDTYTGAGWDFAHTWEMPRLGYPKLRWQSYREPRYNINSVAELVAWASDSSMWTKYCILTVDIDLAGIPLQPVGDGSANFNGVLDGKGHTISNLRVDCDSGGVGMFGIVGKHGVMKNLRLWAIDIRGNKETGGIAGINHGLIRNCRAEGVVSGRGEKTGGLVGTNDGRVFDSRSTATVSGSQYVGGLIGINVEPGHAHFCSSAGEVGGSGDYVGGLAGRNNYFVYSSRSTCNVAGNDYVGGLVGRNDHRVDNCYSRGDVEGTANIGGLVGKNNHIVKYCYATGRVKADSETGGLVGSRGSASTTLYSFWDIGTCGVTTSAGGEGRETWEMWKEETYLGEHWDFAGETKNGIRDLWWIHEDRDYPKLSWESGPAIAPDPPNGAVEVSPSVTLRWIAGAPRLGHDVYFGDNPEAVGNATTDTEAVYVGRQPAERMTYEPGDLELGATYYWRVDEVELDGETLYPGQVWAFTTADFIPVATVDDFEGYDATIWPKRLFLTWRASGGAFVGPDAEREIVHAGLQSMPMFYNNVDAPHSSEAQRTWQTSQDWTGEGADTLTLYFRGQETNDPDSLYVALEDSDGRRATVHHPDPVAAQMPAWHKWHISLADLEAAGVNLAALTKIGVGVGDPHGPQPGGTGKIYIDDLQLTSRFP